jgi:acyl-CoA synthetase (AMP-forming)/AMP-acid ligase II
MLGLTMDIPLLIPTLIEHAGKFHGDAEVVSVSSDRSLTRTDWATVRDRSMRLAQALCRFGIVAGDRVATMAWNTSEHLELYYGVSGIGAVLHTVNPRLFRDQIIAIIEHAQDAVLFLDPGFVSLIEDLQPQLTCVRAFVVLCARDAIPACNLPNLHAYEDLLAAEDGAFIWPSFDERSAASLCYTSGTTGAPKGVLFSHRSTILHTLNACGVDAQAIGAADCVMPVVPMFHVSAWGVPYTAAAAGAKLVLPGRFLDSPSLYSLLEEEGVTLALAVPTVWLGLLEYMAQSGRRLNFLKRVICGGSAVPEAMMDAMAAHGVRVIQAWGMTEMSPVGSTAAPKFKHHQQGAAALSRVRASQGRPHYLVDARIVGPSGEQISHDGESMGDLLVRGPWVVGSYYNDPAATRDGFDAAGWLRTGDVCTIDPDGYIRVTDRSKDMIKSGGEWISSITLENLAVGHPAVAEAAVIGVHHPRWEERPILLVVQKSGQTLDPAALLDFLRGKVAKWWLPDEILLVDDIPHTATGKISKAMLRAQYRGYTIGAG